MRVLQINKFFYPHAGSETALFATRALLAEHGHEVSDFAMQDERNLDSPFAQYFGPHRDYTDPTRPTALRVRDAITSVYSPAVRRRLRALVRAHRPDVAHLHVVYHQLTTAVIDALVEQHVPIVLTAHDLKVACPAYSPFRNGQPCRLCIDGAAWHAVRYRCIKGSLPGSALAAVENQFARVRGSYGKVDAWIAPSAFTASILARAGIDGDRVHVIPNFLSGAELEATPLGSRASEPRFLFAGRLQVGKGVDDLVEVYRRSNGELGTLAIAGAGGELLDQVAAAAATTPHIDFLGRLPRSEIGEELARSWAAVLPAKWEENCSMSVLEAQAASRAVVCSDRGGLPEQIRHGVHGLVVKAGDRSALAAALKRISDDPQLAARMGAAGRERVVSENSPATHYIKLMAAYDAALDGHDRARR